MIWNYNSDLEEAWKALGSIQTCSLLLCELLTKNDLLGAFTLHFGQLLLHGLKSSHIKFSPYKLQV